MIDDWHDVLSEAGAAIILVGGGAGRLPSESLAVAATNRRSGGPCGKARSNAPRALPSCSPSCCAWRELVFAGPRAGTETRTAESTVDAEEVTSNGTMTTSPSSPGPGPGRTGETLVSAHARPPAPATLGRQPAPAFAAPLPSPARRPSSTFRISLNIAGASHAPLCLVRPGPPRPGSASRPNRLRVIHPGSRAGSCRAVTAAWTRCGIRALREPAHEAVVYRLPARAVHPSTERNEQ